MALYPPLPVEPSSPVAHTKIPLSATGPSNGTRHQSHQPYVRVLGQYSIGEWHSGSVFLASMSAWIGSRASTHAMSALSLKIEVLGWHCGGTSPFHNGKASSTYHVALSGQDDYV
ncbi:hypothetical protein F3Y22_tig00111273pilonHSYRG00159 [Hibiscus syriacus]|uniref:Uncharacterized protein n=1 Tax=Hibiscus syriacus TaxID=106335 RepID=A0A6A2YS09_HIBSY|nr:hypothetical protein F3Y22_tig00111273pilonHSYRG00159 [Hibiscus syriacus]